MSDHEIVWTHDGDMVTAEAVCHAAPDANCRLVGVACGCESWTIERDERGPYHVVQVGDWDNPVDERHDMEPGGLCNVCEFINNGDSIEESDAEYETFEIGRVPVDPVWQGEFYEWKRAAE